MFGYKGKLFVKIERALSKRNDHWIDDMFVFYNPCLHVESHQQGQVQKLSLATLKNDCHICIISHNGHVVREISTVIVGWITANFQY